ncbi:unnamed protein product [Urochloa decumbens]|uniref:t-SNARE coiled-coil homology domain-containing protein n=1 Tax=Urochloa decumbens TaxID=240449 RepID=A0ABC9GL20_9POAL
MLRPRHRPSSCGDRTREFRGAVERAGGSLCFDEPFVSEFRRRAAGVGRGIREASRKIKFLLQRANSTSVFDDPTVDIQNMTDAINKEITALKAAVLDLQILCNSQSKGGNISRDAANHSIAVVDILKERLMNAAKEFNGSLRAHQDRRNIFSSSGSGNGSNPSIRQDQPSESIPPAPWAINSNSNSLLQRQRNRGDVSWPSGQKQQLAVQQDSYMQSRAGAIQNIESTTNELAQIFTQLSTMVYEQGDVAIRIDEDLNDTLVNVEAAQGQLLKHLNNISSNRWLMSKIFVVLIVFLLIFVLFIT